MKLETFFEKFELFADAPDAVAKMRGLILRLAMQGRLSEPHKTDGPVGQLLVDIQKDKVQLGLETHIESASAISDLPNNDTSNVIPKRWTWVRFGDVSRHNAGKTLDKGRNRGQLRDYITTSNLYWGFFQLDTLRQMPILDDELERCTAIKGDLLICEGGEAGRAAVWPHNHEICFQNHVHRARFLGGINPYFVQRYFEKLNATNEISNYRKGVGISNMSGKALASIPIPLPPLAEQKRIVAKVDELMALCDRLEAQQQERETQHAALARASLARFANAPTPANLDLLFHKSYSISPADLRKSILTLAVQGKLVPQDPNDEPAETLLEIIAKQRDRLLSANLLRKGKACRQFTSEETPHDVPETWTWTMLGEITDIGTGSTPSRTESSFWVDGTVPWITSGSTSVSPITEGDEFVTPAAVKAHRLRVYPAGTLLVALYGQGKTRGQVALLEIPATINQACAAVCSLDGIPPMQGYLKLLLEKQYDEMRSLSAGGAQPNLNVQKIKEVFVPLPPLAEQRRIVAKVDELMALVDALEAQLATAHSTGATLMKAAVSELTAAA